MAEPTTPAGDPGAGDPRAADARTTPESDAELLAPPTDEELAATGEPSAEEIHAAAAGSRAEEPVQADTRPAEPEAAPGAARTAPAPEPATPVETERDRPVATPVAAPEGRGPAEPATAVAPAPAPAQEQAPIAPAAEAAPPPRGRGNRLVGTAWVLLAAGLFEVLYFGVLGLIVLLLGGAGAVVPQLTNLAAYPFSWLPVLFFFLFFELTVLLFNRAGRFAYVVASLIVGFLVYVVSVLLISIMIGGGIGDTATLARAFESPEFVFTGLVAREVMLWTGFAIGSRGIRVRRRNSDARARYDEELADDRV
ncbi:hypothetical protein [Amnibacterium sp.]|uniref:hypothetical protein n=1 Tax=Amnibacterium sp. TaxID=1872496 RepID=UPI003F7BA54F